MRRFFFKDAVLIHYHLHVMHSVVSLMLRVSLQLV